MGFFLLSRVCQWGRSLLSEGRREVCRVSSLYLFRGSKPASGCRGNSIPPDPLNGRHRFAESLNVYVTDPGRGGFITHPPSKSLGKDPGPRENKRLPFLRRITHDPYTFQGIAVVPNPPPIVPTLLFWRWRASFLSATEPPGVSVPLWSCQGWIRAVFRAHLCALRSETGATLLIRSRLTSGITL